MNLSRKLAQEFDDDVRSRGASYYLGRKVDIEAGSSTQAYAHVKGSRQYQTSLEWEDGTLFAVCDCPYFESVGPCKHLWATILAAEGYGHVSEAASARALTVDFGVLNSDDDDEDEEEFKLLPQALIAEPPPAPKPPSWQTQLAGIANVRLQASRSPDAW